MPATVASTTAISLDDLVARAAGGDSYGFLALARPALRKVPEHGRLRLAVLQHYGRLGLIGAALEVAAGLPDDLRRQLDADGVLTQLSNVATGQIPWSTRRDCFAANLAVLAGRGVNAAAIERAWRAASHELELYRCRDGNFQISRAVAWASSPCLHGQDARATDGTRVWLPKLTNHRADAEKLAIPRLPNRLMPPPYLLESVDLGGIVERLAAATRNVFLTYSPAIYWLAPEPVALAAALHLFDWRALLSDERIMLFVGDDAVEQLRKALEADEQLALPAHCIRAPRWFGGQAMAIEPKFAAVEGSRLAVCESLLAEVGVKYAARDRIFWARRYASAAEANSLSVLLAVSRHTTYLKYAIRDLAAAFESRRWRALVIMEDADHKQIGGSTYLRAVRDFEPDMVFIIDHFRHEYRGAFPANVPFVGWIQDLLPNLYCREAGRSLGPLDFYIAPNLAELTQSYDYPAAQGMAWTTATDHRLYNAEPMGEEELAPYVCDFSYVSSHSKPPQSFHDERRARFASEPGAAGVLDQLFESVRQAMADHPRTACATLSLILDEVLQRSGWRPTSPQVAESILHYYLIPLGELLFRQSTLEWVADYCDRTNRTLHLYGNGWDEHPRFARYARGFAHNGPQLRAIHQASRVNLQIISTGTLHQRLLDGLSAGGFFLIRYSPADVMHEPARRFLAAVQKYDARPGVRYAAAGVPDLAAAIQTKWDLRGLNRTCTEFAFGEVELRRFADMEAGRYRGVAGAVFPEYADVSFASADEFAAQADRYLDDDVRRSTVAASMRSAVIQNFTYGALVDDLLAFVRRRLQESSRSIHA